MRAALVGAGLGLLGLVGLMALVLPWWIHGVAERGTGEAMVRLRIRDVIPLSGTGQSAIILTPTAGQMIVPVLVDRDEGERIAARLHGAVPGTLEPLDLLRSAIVRLGGKVERVELEDVSGGAVQARVIVVHGGKALALESGAATSLGLAVAAGVPVLATRKVVERLGLTAGDIHRLGKMPAPPGGSGRGGLPL